MQGFFGRTARRTDLRRTAAPQPFRRKIVRIRILFQHRIKILRQPHQADWRHLQTAHGKCRIVRCGTRPISRHAFLSRKRHPPFGTQR